jgi:hypothetical protein
MAAAGNYITETEITTWPTEMEEEEKQRRIDLAEEMVENITGQVFYAKTFSITLNGNNLRRLFLPFAFPILSVTLLKVGTREISSADYDFDENSIYGPYFPRGRANITIEGTYGSASTPKGITQIVRKIVDSENDPVLYQKYFYKSEHSGEYSYTRDDKGELLTGLLEVDLMLKQYQKRRPILL